jgi:hypothetical protein
MDEEHVAQTTPQGSQLDAVEHGHEDRDVNVRSIMGWLTFVGVFTAVTLVGITLLFKTLNAVNSRNDKLPSPLFVEKQLPPPPYIEGLIVNGKVHGMTQHLLEVRKRESAMLEKWKLGKSDAQTWSVPISDDMVAEVAKENPRVATEATDEDFLREYPSDGSGGLRSDFRQ